MSLPCPCRVLAVLALVEDGLGDLAPEDNGEALPGGDLPVHLLLSLLL